MKVTSIILPLIILLTTIAVVVVGGPLPWEPYTEIDHENNRKQMRTYHDLAWGAMTVGGPAAAKPIKDKLKEIKDKNTDLPVKAGRAGADSGSYIEADVMEADLAAVPEAPSSI